jgi:hypothetical protein
MKFYNIKDAIFITVLLFLFSFCSKRVPTNYIKPDSIAVKIAFDSVFSLKKDSLYTDLIVKIHSDSIYIPVMQYIMDNLNPLNVHFGDTLFSEYFENEYLFENPLKYLKKIKINNYTLVIVDFTFTKELGYFIVNENNKVIDHIYFTSYRETVTDRKIYDWNHDGKDDLIEIRKYQGQMFEAYTDVVYSITNDSLRLIFSLTTREVDCSIVDNFNIGHFLSRKYTYLGNEIYLISETKGTCDCNNPYFKSIKTLTLKNYQMNTQELLREYGEKYERDRKSDLKKVQ